MNKIIRFISITTIISTSFIGCASLQPTLKSQTLYLDDYSNLSKVDTHNGGKALVWINPQIKMQNYKTLSYQQIKYYTDISTTDNVTQDVLNKVLNYTNTQVKNELAKNYKIVNMNADIEFRGVITKVDTSTKTMKIYEALPIMMVYSGGKYLTGQRELSTQIIFEGQFIDKKTGLPVLKYLQSIDGEQLKNKKAQMTLDNVKNALDLFAQDLATIAK